MPWPPPMQSDTRPRLQVPALHLVQDLGRDDGAGGGDRMAERNRAAVGVDDLAVEPQVLDDGQRLSGERLVQLDDLDLVERACPPAPSPCARPAPGRCPSPSGRRRRWRRREREREPACPAACAFSARHQHQRGAGVVHARRVAGGHGAVLAEDRLQLRHRLDRGVAAARARPARTRRPLLATSARSGRSGSSNRPASIARHARRCDSTANSSWPRSEIPCDSARFSAVTPIWMCVEGIGQAAHDRVDHPRVTHARAPASVRDPVGPAAHRLGAAGDRDIGITVGERLRVAETIA